MSTIKKTTATANDTDKQVKMEIDEAEISTKSIKKRKNRLSSSESEGENTRIKISPLKEVKIEPKRKVSPTPKSVKESPTKESKENVVKKSNIKEQASKVTQSSKILPNDYNPNKDMLEYDPIEDACWSYDESVPYLALAKTFYTMEQTKKRLELINILSNYFRSCISLTPRDLVASVYLCLNKVSPDYEGLELGVGDTILFKALAQATGRTLDKLKSEMHAKGDIGLVAESNRCNQKLIFTPKKLTVTSVFAKLREIALLSGNSSQAKKCDLIKGLIVSGDSIEARYILRSLSGKLRIGLAEQSALNALSNAITLNANYNDSKKTYAENFKKNKTPIEDIKKIFEENSKKLKNAYYQCPNYEIVVKALLKDGIDKLNENCKLTPGIPLKPMLAYPTNGIAEVLKRFDGIEFTCEYKYDGERTQMHIMDNGKIQFFSRNSENNTSKYPDVDQMLRTLYLSKPKTVEESIKSAIIDGEVVAYDTKNKLILPFQTLSTRKRKDAAQSDIKVEVCIFAFDLLFINGQSLINEPLIKRRELLEKHFPAEENKFMYATSMTSNDIEQIQEFLDQSVKDGCEGLMVKTLKEDAHYEISKRSHNWLKLKKDYLESGGDTLDLVVIGGYLGTGKRTGLYGGYLLACYDPDNEEYQTICKIGTGFKDEDLEGFAESLKKLIIQTPRPYYRINDQLHMPDHWFDAEMVWEVKCADFSLSPVHTSATGLIESSKGISLRFPRFLRIRDDKKSEDSTSSKQVADMYKSQQQMINQNNNKKIDDDEEMEED